MVSVKEVSAEKFIARLKDELKKIGEIKPPEWMKFAKSGAHCERPPEQPDFWYIRSASVFKRIYMEGIVGTERLRSFYGGARQHGYSPKHFKKASGNILRKILQQLEKAGLVEKTKRGRKITPKGQKLLDNIAYEVSK